MLLTGRRYGEPPPNPFGGLPVSELAIFFGAISAIVGWADKAKPAWLVGIVVCALGVTEVTAREHFSGYRSHTTLLAGIAGAVVAVALIVLVGGALDRGTVVLIALAVFGILVWPLRKRNLSARHARLIRPPAP
jgi:hypothetical protein